MIKFFHLWSLYELSEVKFYKMYQVTLYMSWNLTG